MSENGFVPFVPRRLQRASESATNQSEILVAERGDSAPHERAAEQGRLGVDDSEGFESETAIADDSLHAVDSSVGRIRAEADAACICAETDAARIRATAIRIAAAACARALHYAVDRNPRLVARFVDDALRAAGGPHNAVVRVAPSATSVGAASKEHDFVADSSLNAGDVFVDCAGGTLGATLEERAELLVRAVAS
jgi:hypothetical protein